MGQDCLLENSEDLNGYSVQPACLHKRRRKLMNSGYIVNSFCEAFVVNLNK